MISKVMNVEIRKLLIAGQYRLKEFFFLHHGRHNVNEPVFKEVPKRKPTNGYTHRFNGVAR